MTSASLLAALPMYDRAETATANDTLWAAIRGELGHGPETLTRGGDLWALWQSPDLLLAQTCGLPYRARLHDAVRLVGTPDYGLDGCPPGYYRSIFIARRTDRHQTVQSLAGQRFAYNEGLSQSGWAAPALHMQERGLSFGALIQTGSHQASARAVAEGRADFAAIDALTWALITAHDPFAANLRSIAETTATPGLPFITALARDPAPLFNAIRAAISNVSTRTRAALSLRGLVHIPETAYLAMPTPPPLPLRNASNRRIPGQNPAFAVAKCRIFRPTPPDPPTFGPKPAATRDITSKFRRFLTPGDRDPQPAQGLRPARSHQGRQHHGASWRCRFAHRLVRLGQIHHPALRQPA
ncbi:phosphate/phosphite/phosphonate ABC transporter substrate-binding protein [Aquicoccus sp. G2-2]|uniref:phosphate/phosphite/phosphonate ABC transporter substrate-binding protein n=1 Tax=Aquicoccus sp. G2-2 TaxID=3092120 RepID=UPI002AE09515|nr:PhnD/SsuA/transferrin family substrate-binding protein [Aquicoccus sp. G2-2]MEA1112734.1 PhnD/SsuA/transferrin family substrate-binding protein [Aquicoccus sp. G2-2]